MIYLQRPKKVGFTHIGVKDDDDDDDDVHCLMAGSLQVSAQLRVVLWK